MLVSYRVCLHEFNESEMVANFAAQLVSRTLCLGAWIVIVRRSSFSRAASKRHDLALVVQPLDSFVGHTALSGRGPSGRQRLQYDKIDLLTS